MLFKNLSWYSQTKNPVDEPLADKDKDQLIYTILHPYVTSMCRPVVCGVEEVDFRILWIFNFLQFAIDGKNSSKTKVVLQYP
jgi:hypothetical protein